MWPEWRGEKWYVCVEGPNLTPPNKNIETVCVRLILYISETSRPQKWIQHEIRTILVVSGGRYDENNYFS